jgi:uroporphyrinogen decarboxylase
MIAAISVKTYTERVLPHHRRYYDALDPERTLRRTMHLCGDSGRHFPAIVAGCGVSSFDTGFPLDFAAVRAAVGPSVEILGGMEVDMLLNGTPKAVYDRARAILTSGVLEGRCFILREANNLPPCVPLENLAAMYRAALEFGCYKVPSLWD